MRVRELLSSMLAQVVGGGARGAVAVAYELPVVVPELDTTELGRHVALILRAYRPVVLEQQRLCVGPSEELAHRLPHVHMHGEDARLLRSELTAPAQVLLRRKIDRGDAPRRKSQPDQLGGPIVRVAPCGRGDEGIDEADYASLLLAAAHIEDGQKERAPL
jgi:hypothetical protein